MELTAAIRKRRMIRNFTEEPVDPAAIDRILDLARRAPSAGYTQGQSFIVVTDPAMRRAVAACCMEDEYVSGGFDPFISKAPVHVLVCTSERAYHDRYQQADKVNEDGSEIEWPVPYWHVDAGCAAMIVLLAAVDEGLGAGFAGVIDHQALRSLLGIPDTVTAIGVIPIGHPAPDVPSPSLKRGRKHIETVVHRERWTSPTESAG
jgi:nitroreductase